MKKKKSKFWLDYDSEDAEEARIAAVRAKEDEERWLRRQKKAVPPLTPKPVFTPSTLRGGKVCVPAN